MSPSPSAWRDLRALLDRALEEPPEGRARLLAEVARTDPAQAEELAALLRADGVGESPLDAGVASWLAAAVAADPAREAAVAGESRAASRLGAWRLGEVLGQGGMGTVYAAERDDGVYRQSAAVKVLRRAVDTPAQRARFERERQLLATLDHPAIVRVLDGGVTDDGVPWFALERVAGAPLTQHCSERQLPWTDRLRLHLEVCAAVEAAHRRLVVHRDLKPSNILVTAEGRVKLLDFGIAKVLEETEAEVTRTEARVLTPQYAAPEQILGETTTTAVDVYALGVLLYELLTGSVPHRRTTGSVAALARQVDDETVEPPSRRLASARRQGAVARGAPDRAAAADLDAVVLKAMRHEPERRYGSVAELAADLRRLLAGQAVEARGSARGYRLRRFVARHRWGVGASALVAAALLLGLAGTLWQARQARAERDRTRLEAAKAQETARFLAALFQNADPSRSRGERLTVREVLDRGAARIDRELAGQPELAAAMLSLIGAVYRDLGLLAPARAALEQAAATAARATGEDSLASASALTELAALERLAGHLDRARQVGERALAIRERELGEGDLEVARTLAVLALVDRLQGQPEPGRAKLERALAIARQQGLESGETGRWINHLGLLIQDLGDFPTAERTFREALAVIERSEGGESPLVALALDNLGMALRAQEKRAEALPVLERARALVERTWGTGHMQYGTALNSLGTLLLDMGRLEEASERFRAAARTYEAALGQDSAYLVWPLTNEGLALLDLGRPRPALALFRRALDLRRKLYGDEHGQVASSHSDVGLALLALGDLGGAEAELRRGVAIARRTLEPGSTVLAEQIVYLADCLVARGEKGEAGLLYAEALPTFRAAFPAGHSSIRHCEEALARLATPPATARPDTARPTHPGR